MSKELLQDKFLVEQSNKIAKMFLQEGDCDINMVCKIVKGYQKRYSIIKQFNPELALQFDAIAFWKVSCKDINN